MRRQSELENRQAGGRHSSRSKQKGPESRESNERSKRQQEEIEKTGIPSRKEHTDLEEHS